MNAAFYLTPKSSVTYLYGDYTVKQGLDKMKTGGYTAVPVIERNGEYIGAVSEGDFLWFMFDLARNGSTDILHDIQHVSLKDIINTERYEPVSVNVSEYELITKTMTQNFVPIIDDRKSFIGIVTRQTVIRKKLEEKVRVREKAE